MCDAENTQKVLQLKIAEANELLRTNPEAIRNDLILTSLVQQVPQIDISHLLKTLLNPLQGHVVFIGGYLVSSLLMSAQVKGGVNLQIPAC